MFTRQSLFALFATIAILFAGICSTPALAQAPASSQPLVISRPGVYVLNRDIRVPNGDAITINTSNVTLDLNGRSVSTETAGTGRGIVIASGNGQISGVSVKGGKVGSFAMNVFAENTANLKIDHLQIVGADLAAQSGPGEIGILLVSTRGAAVTHNLITNVGLGIFIRGSLSGGNRISENTLVGGANTPRPLGMCWNPLAGQPSDAPGPKGDLVYNNHVSQFNTGISFSTGSIGNIIQENTIAFINAAFSPATSAVTNVLVDNTTIQVAP
jgi:nitrous oxidase accessory protein NosD